MATYPIIRIRGANGTQYQFQAYPLGTPFKELPGLYVFCYPRANGDWFALYVGQTHNLQDRVGTGLPNHHQIADAKRSGATHVAVMVFNGRESDRIAAESNIINQLRPPLNGTGLGKGLYG